MIHGTDKIQDFIRQASSRNAINTVYYIAIAILTIYLLSKEVEDNTLVEIYNLPLSLLGLSSFMLLAGILNGLMQVSKIVQKFFSDEQFDLMMASCNAFATYLLIYHFEFNLKYVELNELLNSFLPITLFIMITPLTWRKHNFQFYGFYGFLEWVLLITSLCWVSYACSQIISNEKWFSLLSNILVLFSPYIIEAIGRRNIDKLKRKMHREIYTDPLTLISNRKHFYDYYDKIREKNKTSPLGESGLCVLFLDIDFFKQYNDHYGHEEGDVCLRRVAGIIEDFGSKLGFKAFRYGGEEFLLCGIMKENMWHEFLKSKPLVSWKEDGFETGIPHLKSDFNKVTISGGLSFITSEQIYEINAAGAVLNADKKLYESKNNGRNTLTW